MIQQKFVDREMELAYLEEKYATDNAECIVIYGRRRVGKTSLLLKFMDGKPGIYFLASEEGAVMNLRDFSRHAALLLGDPGFARPVYTDWHMLFSSLVHHTDFKKLTKDGKVIIVVDEFPYLVSRDPAVTSVFQKCWDQILSREDVMLILSGSSVGTMETKVLGMQSPLFGRRTGQWELNPLSFLHLGEFLPYTAEECAMTWFVLGGIPAYLLQFDPDVSFWENVSLSMLARGSYLSLEGEFLLTYEFREPANYRVILRALASGCRTMGEICNETGFDKSMVSKYISVLTRLHFVTEERPVTTSMSYRRRHYVISDPYLSFFFRFIVPNRMDIETGRTEAVLQRIRKEFQAYAGGIFESLVGCLFREGVFDGGMRLETLGRWWHGGDEIDLVGLSEAERRILFCECKWSDLTLQEARKVLSSLESKSELVRWKNDEREEIFCIVGKHIEEKEVLNEEGYLAYDLRDIPLRRNAVGDKTERRQRSMRTRRTK